MPILDHDKLIQENHPCYHSIFFSDARITGAKSRQSGY